jgi:hypothetical protein
MTEKARKEIIAALDRMIAHADRAEKLVTRALRLVRKGK